MSSENLSELSIQLTASDATEEEIDRMTRELLTELRGMDVEDVHLAHGSAAPDGTKGVDALTAGSLVLTVLPGLLPKVIDGIQAWVMRGSNRTVKFKSKIAGQSIDFEGSGEDLQRLLVTLQSKGRKM